MKKFLAIIFTLLIVCFGQYCKKSNDASNNNSNNNNSNNAGTAKSTPVGTQVGNKTSKFIPKSGGTISSDDGMLELDFPNGALSEDDTITIQPITNNCPGGNGLGYRLGPEGLKFSQPVTIKFHYPDSVLQSTIPGFMGIAFQDSAGFWNKLKNSTNDTTNHVITALISHFSDWVDMNEVSMLPDHASLKTGNKITLRISKDLSQEEIGGQAAPITTPDEPATITWKVNGVENGNSQYGTISDGAFTNGNDNVIYTAPNAAPNGKDNPVLVSAEIKGDFKDIDGQSYNKIILYARIFIFDGGYHVDIKFQAPDKEYCSYYTWKDEGSFDVVFAGSTGSVKNINNSPAVIRLDSTEKDCTCTTTITKSTIGPINIVDSSFATINPATNMVDIIFNALDQKNYIEATLWHFDCGGGDTGDFGGGLGPPLPTYIEFAKSDQTQTIAIPPFATMTVTPLK